MRRGFVFKKGFIFVLISLVIVFSFFFKGAGDTPTGSFVNVSKTAPNFRGLGDGGEVFAGGAINIDILENIFFKQVIKVKKGSTVIWLNKDLVDHQVIGVNSVFESGVLSRGSSFAMDFDVVGVYDYYDKLNPSMIGRVIVVE